MTNNEIIKLRSKPTGNGNRSLYLDLYYKGDRRYEFLHLYLVPERTKSDRLKNEVPVSIWLMCVTTTPTSLASCSCVMPFARRQARIRFPMSA